MATFLFIHGTGVRENDVANSVKLIEAGISGFNQLKEAHSVKFCFWGGELGTPTRTTFLSIPDYESRGGEVVVDEKGESNGLWELLYADPFFEINLLIIKASGAEKESKAITAMRKDLKSKLDGLTKIKQELETLLVKGGLQQHFESCRKSVSDSSEFQSLIDVAVPPMGPYRRATARSICALSAITSNNELIFPRFQEDRELRKEIIDKLTSELGGEEAFIPSWVAKPFIKGFLKHVHSQFGRYVRDNYRFVGDILLYQTKGSTIRKAIKAKINECDGPVVILGHSLGGIASFDMLVEEAKAHPNGDSQILNKVTMFVTVGSQVPFLYELNCLQSLRNDGKPEQAEKLPLTFPKRWLNCYDPNDLLSYVAEGLFPGNLVKDIPVKSNTVFPEAHSAYWSQQTMWKAIEAGLTQ